MLILCLSVPSLGRIEAPKAPIKHQPVSVQSVKAAVAPIATQALCRAIQTVTPDYTDAVAGYFRQIGNHFCDMQTSGDFSYAGLERALEKIPSPLLTESYVVDVRLALAALYKVHYGDRLRAEIPPDRWLSQLSQVFCEAISEGLKDAGRTGAN